MTICRRGVFGLATLVMLGMALPATPPTTGRTDRSG